MGGIFFVVLHHNSITLLANVMELELTNGLRIYVYLYILYCQLFSRYCDTIDNISQLIHRMMKTFTVILSKVAKC